ncbi:MAG TPA: hypothetical protein VK932_03200 [Kofleriaceae bacterium]|nr:hypothetical protein [Kofleriaceae bacterium]
MRCSLVLVLVLLLGGCLASFGDSQSSVEGKDDDANCKIEGSQIGREGVTLAHGTRTVTFRKWVSKAGEPNELVGFSLEAQGATSLSYRVKAGGEVHRSIATTWLHPAGVNGGTNAPAISNIQFCDCDCSCDGDDGGGDGGGGGDDGPIIL